MDRITASLLEEFSKEEGITKLPEDQRFEHFTTFLCLQRHYSEAFDTADVVTGSGGDTGIDGLAIVVNGALVTDPETIQDLAISNGFLDATFIFVQAERSSGFETAKIGTFSFGAVDFFKEKPSLPQNDKIKEAASIMDAIYKNSGKFKRGNPSCKLYYVTTGKVTNDQNLEARRQAAVNDLTATSVFRDVDFQLIGADQIQKLYRQSKNAISREFTFSERTTMPEMPAVKEAYLGLIPAPEFIKLLQDEDGDLIKSLFYDNVRDWQDYNQVNSEMKTTLQSVDRTRFALMNNGVTIIAKTLRPTGDRFYIEDYQIVNGCQTSHVLFNERANLDQTVMVPLRLISTQDESVITSIIKATNRQTEVRAEQLLALSDFPKKIEAFFHAYDPAHVLHYERRSRQYNDLPGIEKTRIITPANLIRAFAAVFMEEPHRTTRNYGALLEQVGKAIFVPDHRLEMYLVAAYSLYQLEYLFRNQLLDNKYKPARFQILMVARMLLDSKPLPRPNSHEMEKYCKFAFSIWWNQATAEDLLKKAATVVDGVALGNLDRDSIRTQPFTEKLKIASTKITWTPSDGKPAIS